MLRRRQRRRGLHVAHAQGSREEKQEWWLRKHEHFPACFPCYQRQRLQGECRRLQPLRSYHAKTLHPGPHTHSTKGDSPCNRGSRHRGHGSHRQRQDCSVSRACAASFERARLASGAFLFAFFQALFFPSHVLQGCRCVIMSPTRELALQTIRFTRELSKFQNLRACLLVGGDSMGDQFAALSQV